MSEATERLLVRIDATTEVLRRELKKADDAVKVHQTTVEKSLAKIDKAFESIKKGFTGLGVVIGAAGLGLAFKKIVNATADQERVTAQLNATLKSTGGAAGKTSQELVATAASLQKLTRYSDESIIGMQSLLLTFKEIKGDNFDRTTKAVLDMSTAMGQDLKSSAVQLGKALNDPITGLSALSRVGVTFSDSQKKIIKGLVETGRVAEAQVLILQELESEFGGSAVAARETLGGALEGLGNAFDDLFEAQSSSLGPMKQSLNEVEAILSDPEFVAAVHELTAAIISMGAAAAKALPVVIQWAKTLGEDVAASIGGIASDDIPRLEKRLSGLQAYMKQMESMGQTTGPTVRAVAAEIEELSEKLRVAKSFQEGMTESLDGAKQRMEDFYETLKKGQKISQDEVELQKEREKRLKEVEKVYKKMAAITDKIDKRHEKANQTISDGVKELDEMVASGDRYIEQLEFEVSLIGKTAREQALLTIEHDKSGKVTDAQLAKIKALNMQLYDAKAATDAAAAAQKPFQDALQGTVERIDTMFADMWTGGLDSFDDFSEGLKNAFKSLLGELAHLAFTRPIIMSFTSALGLGGSAAASAAGPAGSGIFGGVLSSLSSSVSSFLTSPYYTNTGLQMAVPGDGGAALTPQFSWVNAGAGFAGGLGGSYLSNQVFGPTSGVGSTLGGLGGAAAVSSLLPALGPWGIGLGALFGSFGGGGLESLFGGKNNGDNKGRADLDFLAGTSNVYGVGKSFNQANVDAAGQVADVLKQFASLIGDTNANLRIAFGNKSGPSLNGVKYDSVDELINAAFDVIVEGSQTLQPYIKKLLQEFEGTAEEAGAFAVQLITLNKAIEDGLLLLDDQKKNSPYMRAVDDFAKSQMRLGDIYLDQVDLVKELTASFDGSLDSLTNLNGALAISNALVYEMAKAIEEVSLSSTNNTRSTKEYLRERTRTSDETLQYLEGQFQFLYAMLPGMKDPAQIQQAGDFMLELIKKIFDAGSPELQRANLPTYLDLADSVDMAVQGRLEQLGVNVQEAQQTLNQDLQAMLTSVGNQFQESADTFYSAAQLMYNAVNEFNNRSQYAQVVA